MRARTLIDYFLKSTDSLQIDKIDSGDTVQYTFTIFDDVVEIIGNKIIHDTTHIEAKGKISKYDFWIDKKSNLPFMIVRDMPHNKSTEAIRNAQLNNIKLEDFVASKYFPEGYEIRQYKVSGKERTKNVLEGKKAPAWILNDFNNNSFSLHDLKSKVLLIEFTGIGCGPCRASIPFLKQLALEYKPNDFDLISIETWRKNAEAHRTYYGHYELNYKFLISDNQVEKDYKVSGVPVFFILDENRIIRKVISGYGKGTTDKEIREAINELI